MDTAVPYIHWRIIPFGDTDAARIVYAPRFADYCMEAAEVWFRDHIDFDWYRISTELGMGVPIVRMELDIVGPLRGGDRLGVVVRVAKMGRSTVTLAFEGVREHGDAHERAPSFTATFVHCFTSVEVSGSVAVPEEQRRFIRAYRAACEAVEASS
jgi:4-hydroxybenzoyl-CoA thioesterase